MSRRTLPLLLAGLAAVLSAAGCSKPAYRDADAAQEGPTISGRILDPDGLLPDETTLTARSVDDGRSGAGPIRRSADGRFLTPPLWPGTYVLRLIRTPHSRTHPATLVGLVVVPVKTANVTGVTITVQRDVTITGQFRMESDNPAARWPPHIHVIAPLVVNGAAMYDGTGSEGASGGRFVLRNPIGPRILRTGYSLEPDHPWWPSRVLLDGNDVNNVPTDFSQHEGSRLEVVFTQHPARITGTVEDAGGAPLPEAWIVACAADANPCVPWTTTTHIVRASKIGAFRFAASPGRYLVRAFHPTTFSSRQDAEGELANLGAAASPVDVKERGLAQVRLVVK
jgi:hypothetical protein